MNYSYDKKKEIYNKLNQLIETKKNDRYFIKNLLKMINKEENNNFILQNENGYYINLTKLSEETLETLEHYLKNV